jgi:aminoglycoside 6'-N-acetyltransferase
VEASDRDGIVFRPLSEQDLPLLQVWLSRPHVAKWWRQPLDLEGVRSMFRPAIEGRKPTHVYVIEREGRPAGWIQWYRWSDFSEHAARLGAEPNTAGIDLAIGEPGLLGQGIGPRAIATFLQRWVFVDPTITACVVDPDERNLRSIRALEKAGFVALRTVYSPVQQRSSLVMRLARTDSPPA